jgi:hypothetical protein
MGATADELIRRREAAAAVKAEAEAAEARAKESAAQAKAKAAAKRSQGEPWTHRYGDTVNPVTPGGVGSAAALVMIAGTIAFLGSMREAKMFPPNGVRIIFSTLALAIVLSLFDHSRFSPIVRGVAGLMVLTAVIRYVPKFSKKGK